MTIFLKIISKNKKLCLNPTTSKEARKGHSKALTSHTEQQTTQQPSLHEHTTFCLKTKQNKQTKPKCFLGFLELGFIYQYQ